MILLVAAALHLGAGAPAAAARPRCALRQLSACGNTNQLVRDKAFQRQVKRFAGNARTDVFGNRLLADQLLETLGGPPDAPVTLPGGNMLFTACVAHDCPDKGAIVLTPAGEVVAAATLTNHFVHEGDVKWHKKDDAYSRLDVFVRVRPAGEPAWRTAIVNWAKAAYHGDRAVFDKYWSSSGLTESDWLIAPGSSSARKLDSRKIIESSDK